MAAVIDGQTLEGFSEPCALIARDGTIQAASRAFVQAAALCRDGRLEPEAAEAMAALVHDGGGRRRAVAPRGDDRFVYDLTLLPTTDADAFLVLVQDRTLDSGLRNALAESRARYKELVSISGDQAWEVDERGTFSFTGPQGLAGHAPETLIGRPAADLVDAQRHIDPINPFITPVPITGTEVWIHDGADQPACLEVAAVPLIDRNGVWIGARGVCRDVTEERRRTAEVAEARARDRVLARIMRLFQCEADPESMIRAAASAITHGMAATGCQIFGLAAPLAKVIEQPRFHPEIGFGRPGSEGDAERLIATLRGQARGTVNIQISNGQQAMGIMTAHGDRLNGAVLIWRDGVRPVFTDADERLMRSIAAQVGVALEQLTQHRVLVQVSRTDGLTGLFNRRAFYEDIQRRIRRLEHGGGSAALMYVDLDNFKQVNDIRGHDVGDAALRDVADLLRANTRSTDLVARLGGDEFAVWLEDADAAVASKRAEVFLAASAILRRYSGNADAPLMLSIGIALYDPTLNEDINDFVSRADAAMYAIKRRGKGSYGIAPTPGPVSPGRSQAKGKRS